MEHTGPKAMRVRLRGSLGSITVASILQLVPVVHAEGLSNGANTGIGASNYAGSQAGLYRSPFERSEGLSYGVGLGIGASDNVLLESSLYNPKTDAIAVADLDFTYSQQSRRLDADLQGNFSYLDYLKQTYGNQFIGRFDGLATLSLIPERLTWMLEDNFGQAQLDPFAPVTPVNRQNVNYVTTGPDLSLNLGPSAFLRLGAHYSRAKYEDSPFDSTQTFGSIALGRRLSPHSSLSLNGTFEHFHFDQAAVNTDFNRYSPYLRYELQGARTNLGMNAGVTELKAGPNSTSGPLLQLDVARKLSPSATLVVSAGRQIIDASGGFRNLQIGAFGGIGTAPSIAASSNYVERYASASWRYERRLTSFVLTARTAADTYLQKNQPPSTFDSRRSDFGASVERRLTSVISAEIHGAIGPTRYPNADFKAVDHVVGTALTMRPGRHTEVRLRYDHIRRTASAIVDSYHENVVFLTVGYRRQ